VCNALARVFASELVISKTGSSNSLAYLPISSSGKTKGVDNVVHSLDYLQDQVTYCVVFLILILILLMLVIVDLNQHQQKVLFFCFK
jgi:uncharacterized integral membrane protein